MQTYTLQKCLENETKMVGKFCADEQTSRLTTQVVAVLPEHELSWAPFDTQSFRYGKFRRKALRETRISSE